MIANSTALVLTRQSGLFSCQKYDSIIYLAGFGGTIFQRGAAPIQPFIHPDWRRHDLVLGPIQQGEPRNSKVFRHYIGVIEGFSS